MRGFVLLLLCSAMIMAEDPTPVEAAPAPNADAALLAATRAANEDYQRTFHLFAEDIASADEAVRVNAIRQFGWLQDPEAAKLLMPFLDAHTHTRAEVVAAAESLCDLGHAPAAVRFQQLLEAADPEIRLAALNGLSRLKAMTAAEYMRKARDDRDSIRGSAATNLGTLKHEEALDVLIKGLSGDHDPHVRRMCAIGLGRLGNKDSAKALTDGLSDSDPGVRRYCAESLVRLGHKQAIPSLLMAMEANVAGEHLNRCVMILSGQDFGFDARANPIERANAIEKGYAWWAENAAKF